MDSIQCHICSLPFPTQQQLQQHIWHYQTEIAKLLAKLHELFAHQSTELDITESSADTHASLPSIVNTVDIQSGNDTLPQLPTAQTADEAESQPQRRGIADGSNPSDHQRTFACPECDAVLARKQDLERHYTIHYQCKEFCQFCSNTFTRARKYITHRCAKSGLPNQRTYTKRRCIVLCAEAKRELYAKKTKSTYVAETASQTRSRPRKVLGIGNGNDTRCRLPLPSSDMEGFEEVGDHGPSRQTSDILNPDDSTFVASVDALLSRSPQLHPPLFLPFGIDWQSQLPEFPMPLWSTVSLGAGSTSLPSRHGPASGPGSLSGQQFLETTARMEARAEAQDELSFDCL
ncbi:hypothetical protein LZ32DRAFT_670234 [Colletotrichum eremochloae]|nr:hypothetical protein LZ32DRAFT_670234 [Colletotrichum eremochloae]